MTAASPSGIRRWRSLTLLGGLAAIVLWQSVFYRHGDPETTLASSYRLTASTGVQPWQPEFVYFLYYLNLYPVVSVSNEPLEYSVEGARRLIAERGETLAMDRYWTVRYGELAKTYLYLPHAWLKGRPVKLRMLPASALGFTVALAALFAAFWYVGETILGAILVVLMGSNPFQVNEVYANNNLFGWPISITLLMLALHVPLLYERWRRPAAVIALAMASGLLLGTFRQIRTEPVLVAGALCLIYLTATRFRLWQRAAFILLLGAGFSSTATGWSGFFESKYREAWTAVKAAGGHTFDGTRQRHHFFWHALWCGLGDFDRKYGYEWSDVKAFSYAWPILQQRGFVARGFPLTAPDECCDPLTLGVYWDEGRKYARTPQELPEYIEIIREKVLRDIRSDPLWYASILLKRLHRVIAESTPPSLAVGNGWSVSLPGRAIWGWLSIGVGLVLLWRADWRSLKLLAFTLPLAATAVLIYSDHGVTLYSVAHLVAFAILLRSAWSALWTSVTRAHTSGANAVAVKPLASAALSRQLGRRVALAVALGISAAAVGAWFIGGRGGGRRATDPVAASRPSLAVFRFENQTSREELTWVGDALGELLTSEIAHAGVRVLDPDAVANLDSDLVWWGPYGVLNGTEELAVNVVADRSGAPQVVVGRVRGDPRALRACVELRTPGRGASLLPERCEPIEQSRIFEASRSLARGVLGAIGVATPSGNPSHGSPEGYRLYAEALGEARRELWGNAIRRLDAALAIDPRLHPARLLRARSLARFTPLSPRVLSDLAGTDELGAVLAALRAGVRVEPHSAPARIDLARLLVALELYREAVTVLEDLRATPGSPPAGLGLLAEAKSALGDLPGGYLVALEAQRRSRHEPRYQGYFADQLVRWDELDKAMFIVCAYPGLANCIDKQRAARGLAADTLDDLVRQWRIRALAEEWRQADELASRMIAVDDTASEGIGSLYVATGQLFAGRTRLAGALAEEAAFRLARQELDATPALRMAAEVSLERGDPMRALELIRSPSRSGGDPRLQALESVALARAGRWDAAEAYRRALAARVESWPGPIAQRALHQLDGELALLRGDPRQAVAAFSEAERLLEPRGFCGDHVPIWYGLGRAHLAAANLRQAETWFDRVANATFERLCWPIPYVKALAQLGHIRAADGRMGEAAESYERFLNSWGDGDLAEAERSAAIRFRAAQASAASNVASN